MLIENIIYYLSPYLPAPLHALLTALAPLLALLSSPINLFYTLTTNPRSLQSTVLTSLTDVFYVLRDLPSQIDINALRELSLDDPTTILKTLGPWFLSAFVLWTTVRSARSGLRYLYSFSSMFLRWGSLLGLGSVIISYFLGNGAPAQGNGLANLLGQMNGGGGAGFGNQMFGMARDYLGGQNANQGWAETAASFLSPTDDNPSSRTRSGATKDRNAKTKAKAQSKYRTPKKPASDPVSDFFSNLFPATPPPPSGPRDRGLGAQGPKQPEGQTYSDYASKWVKHTLLKASGLDGIFGEGQPGGEEPGSSKGGKKTRSR